MLLCNIMVSLITPAKAQKKLVENSRARRLQMDLTQKGLSDRSGVPLPTLRKFEQTGRISLAAFLKIQLVLGGLEAILTATQIETSFSSMDRLLAADAPRRKRGKRT
jgi:transcriptional regulator with XRE-family HTH domain